MRLNPDTGEEQHGDLAVSAKALIAAAVHLGVAALSPHYDGSNESLTLPDILRTRAFAYMVQMRKLHHIT